MSSFSEHRRPRLLPQNRKLQHLKGLSLRNLSFEPARLRSADDTSLNRGPNKLQVLRESGQLHQSRSSETLRQDSRRPQRPQRPRRTSLSLSHATPATRQRRLESLVDGLVGDAFFSLHVLCDAEPVYISEVRQRSANFNFQFFDLAYQPPDVSRSSQCIVRVWARRPKRPAWVFLLEEFVDLRRLNFIGGLMGRRFPSNALLFHLEDGLYSMDFPNNMAEPKQAPPVSTSSYTALMKLANLESSVDDALETRHQIVEQINKILEETPTDGTDAATEAMALAHKYTGAQQRANSLAEKRLDELRRSLESRRAAMAQGRDAQARAEDDMVNNREKLVASRAMVMSTEQQIHGQRRRICSELSTVFPILPVPNAPPLSFQIRDIALPNSVYNATTAKAMNEDVLSAALGLVTLLTHNLQYYLGHPLPYLLFPYGSHSYARDDISQLPDKSNSRREFPLYLPRGGSTVGQWRFEYAWFLLNKDIEALCASQGLRVVDIRHTLPNLKYLLYVCSAGTDEIPERKKGGVRGLWAGRLRGRALPPLATKVPVDVDNVSTAGSSTGSRRGSIDSEVARRHEDDLRRAVATADEHIDGDGRGAGAGAGEMGTSGSGNGAALPFSDGDTMLTLRTKGLRERE